MTTMKTSLNWLTTQPNSKSFELKKKKKANVIHITMYNIIRKVYLRGKRKEL